jgi:hypothetical protein
MGEVLVDFLSGTCDEYCGELSCTDVSNVERVCPRANESRAMIMKHRLDVCSVIALLHSTPVFLLFCNSHRWSPPVPACLCPQLLPEGKEASKYLLWWYLEDQIKVHGWGISLGLCPCYFSRTALLQGLSVTTPPLHPIAAPTLQVCAKGVIHP